MDWRRNKTPNQAESPKREHQQQEKEDEETDDGSSNETRMIWRHLQE